APRGPGCPYSCPRWYLSAAKNAAASSRLRMTTSWTTSAGRSLPQVGQTGAGGSGGTGSPNLCRGIWTHGTRQQSGPSPSSGPASRSSFATRFNSAVLTSFAPPDTVPGGDSPLFLGAAFWCVSEPHPPAPDCHATAFRASVNGPFFGRHLWR